MKMAVRWMTPGLLRRLRLLMMIWCCVLVLADCATRRGDMATATEDATASAAEGKMAPTLPVAVKAEEKARAEGGDGTGSTGDAASDAPIVVPGPDGRTRVLVTARGISLQRQRGGPLEVLECDAGLEFENATRWTEQMKVLAEGVRWSPRGTRVALLRLYKRGSGVAVFSLASHRAAEVELDTNEMRATTEKRYEERYRQGRFYYDKLRRWIDEDHLEIEFSGNLVPKEDDDGTHWKSYQGTARMELGAKTGKVQGVAQPGVLVE